MQKLKHIVVKRLGEEVVLSIESKNENLTYILFPEQLNVLYTSLLNILDPDRKQQAHIKHLKEFKRQVYGNYKSEKDPVIKEQKLALYLETKQLVNDLES